MRHIQIALALLTLTLLAACANPNATMHKPLIAATAAPDQEEQPVPIKKMDDTNTLSAPAFLDLVTKAGGAATFIFGDDRPFAQCHASTITQCPDGALLAAWFGGAEEKNPDVGIWMSRCENRVWTPPRLAAKIEESAHWNPVLFTDAEGKVRLFFKVGPEIDFWRTYWMTSEAGGASWSQPEELVPGDAGGRGPVKNKPIILSDGSWLAPASTEYQQWLPFADHSSDGGRTWTRSEDFLIDRTQLKGRGAIQPTFWESAPGQVHALLRSCAGAVWRCDSSDYGKTWSPIYAIDLPNNNSGLDALQLEDGRLLLVLNPVGVNWGPRTPISLALSVDNGNSWRLVAHFEDDPVETKFEYSYPAIIRTSDGVAVSYTYRRERVRCWFIPDAALPER